MSEKKKDTRIQDLLNRKRKAGNNQVAAHNDHPSTSTANTNGHAVSSVNIKSSPNNPAEDKSSASTTTMKQGEELEAEARRKLIEKRAKDKILFEAKRAKERAEQQGPQGWVRPRSLNTNKNFLHRTLASAMFRPQSKKPRNEEKNAFDRNTKSPTR